MVTKPEKRVDELNEADLRYFPVWEYTNEENGGSELLVRPVASLPVSSLSNRLVGTDVRLANGSHVLGLLGNVDLANPRSTRHFLSLTVFRAGSKFDLARYHDIGVRRFGPEALAAFLGLDVNAVFPIAYDLRELCVGLPEVLVGQLDQEPSERLTRAELIALAVGR